MPNSFVQNIIDKINLDFGQMTKIGDGKSLYEISSNKVVIYFRYSKLTQRSKMQTTFYGLRKEDIKLLSGKNSFICFVWDNCEEPVLLPFKNYEYLFGSVSPSSDGQYKAFIFFKQSGTEFYLANVGKFNVDSFVGLNQLYNIGTSRLIIPQLSHTQVQSLIGAIGLKKGYELWYPEKR